MTTLSPTKARANLTRWLKRAAQGEDIGILCGEQIIALRPVNVYSADYAAREYGATDAELAAFVKRTNAKIEHERKAGRLRRYTGNLHATCAIEFTGRFTGQVRALSVSEKREVDVVLQRLLCIRPASHP